MADMNFERFEGNRRASGDDGGAGFQNFVNLAGAVISVALVVGLAVWGYKLAVRDVSGIPVVLAMEGPMRIAPENPGGTVANNQGLAVNSVAAEGIAAAPAERLVLAPRPVELSLDDAPGLSSMSAEPPVDQLDSILVDAATTPAAAAATEAVDQTAIDAALAAALSEGGDIPVEAAPDDLAATDAAGSVVRSPRPVARPDTLSSTAATPVTDVADVQDVVSVASPEMQPEEVQVGTRLVQLGAFDSADGARAEWTRLQGSFGDLMAGKAIIVQPATSGGQTFFRLRAFGFSDEDDARRFCSALLSEDTSCIPVAHR
jgi:SPOR domain